MKMIHGPSLLKRLLVRVGEFILAVCLLTVILLAVFSPSEVEPPAPTPTPDTASDLWERAREAIDPTYEDEIQFTVSSMLVMSSTWSFPIVFEDNSGRDLLTQWSMTGNITVADLEGRGPAVLGHLDSAGVFHLSTSLGCVRAR